MDLHTVLRACYTTLNASIYLSLKPVHVCLFVCVCVCVCSDFSEFLAAYKKAMELQPSDASVLANFGQLF